MVAPPDAATKAQLLAAAQNGMGLDTMADYAGVPKSRMSTWLDTYARAQRLAERGENLEDFELEILELFTQCVKLRAKLEVGAMGVVIKAASEGHPRSAIWLLQNRFGYGDTDTMQEEIKTDTTAPAMDTAKYRSVSTAMRAAIDEHATLGLSSGESDIVDAELVED